MGLHVRTASVGIKPGGGIRHVAPVLIVGIVGAAVSLAAWYLTVAAEHRAFLQEFSNRANNQAVALQNGIGDYWDELYAVRDLFASSQQGVTRDQFEGFSKSL